MAIVVVLDTLLAASIVDGRLRVSRDANRELVAQGLANVVSAAVGIFFGVFPARRARHEG